MAVQAQWKTLLAVVDRFIKEEAWKWVDSSYLFGVRPPEGKTYYCGFFGFNDPNTRGFHVYYDPQAYFWFCKHRPEDEIFWELAGVVLLLVRKNELDGEDRRLLAELGFTPKTRGRWPQFRNLRPGFHPWYLEKEDVRILTTCLEQGLELARRSRKDPELLAPDRKGRILVRVAEERGGAISWAERREEIVVAERPPVEVAPLDTLKLRRLAKTRLKQEGIWEFDFFYSPLSVQANPGERPYYPFCLLVADPSKGLIGYRLVDREELYHEIASFIMDTILEHKTLPEHLLVRREEIYKILSPLAEALGAPKLLRLVRKLALIDYFRAFLAETADEF